MALNSRTFLLSLLLMLSIHLRDMLIRCTEYEESEIEEAINEQILTCTSAARLINTALKYHLHSHPINYGTGSGQQAVTALKSETDIGSLWMFKEADGNKMWLTGDRILWGQKIRLEHIGTGRNLHSHSFSSPVSGRQEISAFGENGEGDEGDNWFIEWTEKSIGDSIDGKTSFYLKHVSSSYYLYTDASSLYNHNNCRNCPIIGQAEISGYGYKHANAIWRFVSGYFSTNYDTINNAREESDDLDDSNLGDFNSMDDDLNEDL